MASLSDIFIINALRIVKLRKQLDRAQSKAEIANIYKSINVEEMTFLRVLTHRQLSLDSGKLEPLQLPKPTAVKVY